MVLGECVWLSKGFWGRVQGFELQRWKIMAGCWLFPMRPFTDGSCGAPRRLDFVEISPMVHNFLFQHVMEICHSWINGRPASEGHLGNVVDVHVDGDLKNLSPGQRG